MGMNWEARQDARDDFINDQAAALKVALFREVSRRTDGYYEDADLDRVFNGYVDDTGEEPDASTMVELLLELHVDVENEE